MGAVIPVAAAGSLFAGLMSVGNLAYSFGYSSGAWLYEHGLQFSLLRELQAAFFGLPGQVGGELSIQMLILVNSAAYVVSFVCVHLLPDRRGTLAAGHVEEEYAGPERWNVLGPQLLRSLDALAPTLGGALLIFTLLAWELDPVSAVLMTFFSVTMLRKWGLDGLLRRHSVTVSR